MIYYCQRCKFMFERFEEPDSCPDCGSGGTRLADAQQREEYQKQRKTVVSEKWWQSDR